MSGKVLFSLTADQVRALIHIGRVPALALETPVETLAALARKGLIRPVPGGMGLSYLGEAARVLCERLAGDESTPLPPESDDGCPVCGTFRGDMRPL